MKLFIGILLALIVTIVAYKKKSLSLSGAVAAVMLGTGIYFFGGEVAFILMMVFFISSSVLSKIKKSKKSFLDNLHEKGDARDYMQVLANGGVALLFLIIYKVSANEIFFVASAVSFAVSNSDTWASEVGVLSERKPISIINFKEIEAGVSGGISFLGTLSAFLGALLISISFGMLSFIFLGNDINIRSIIIIWILGFLGSILDSILGATIQGQYFDDANEYMTEKRYNKSRENKLVKGFKIINNDMVNLLTNLIITTISILFL